MADLRNFARWDPGVERVEQVHGEGGGADAVFDVFVKGIRGPIRLQYHTISYEALTRVVARARSRLVTSLDTITVRGEGSGSMVTYDAELTLNGLLRVADPILGLRFKKIGDRAADGLIRALGGARVVELGATESTT